jgi:hypothetical protein
MAGVTTALVRAETFITLDDAAEFANTETIVIGQKTYTAQDTLTNVDGNVHIGADVAATLTNLIAAVNISNEGESAIGAGTDYATAMTRNPDVYAIATSATVATFRAHIPGAIGNNIPVANGTGAATVDNATLEGGTGIVADFFDEVLDSVQLNSEALMHLSPFSTTAGGVGA